MKDDNYVDKVMDDLQQSIFINRPTFIGGKMGHNPCDDCREHNGQVINITVKPVIHTTSYVKESTKNPTLGELGNVLTPILNLFKK